MCDTCRLTEDDWPSDWPEYDLTVPDGESADLVMAVPLEDLLWSGGP